MTEDDDDFSEETALSELLASDATLFIGTVQGGPFFTGSPGGQMTLYVNCNDLFMWACADAEPLSPDDILPLWRAWKADPKHGTSKWACVRRGMQPQKPVVKMMKEDGAWDAAMEALPAAPPS